MCVDTRLYRHPSHFGGYAAKAWQPCNGDETPAWRPNLQTFWSLNQQWHMHTNLPQWNKWTVGRTTLRLSMQNREIEALCMTKHDECRGADLQLRLHRHITKCINMHSNVKLRRFCQRSKHIPQFLDVSWHLWSLQCSERNRPIGRGVAASIAGHSSGPRRREALVLRGASSFGSTSWWLDWMIKWGKTE